MAWDRRPVGEAGGSVGRASDFGSEGLGFESAKGKICTALFFVAPVFEITLVVEKDVKPENTHPPFLRMGDGLAQWLDF